MQECSFWIPCVPGVHKVQEGFSFELKEGLEGTPQ